MVDTLIELPWFAKPGTVDPGPRQAASSHLLAVDGGATKSTAIVCLPTGEILGRGRSGPSNARAVGDATAAESLCEAATEALRDADMTGDRVDVAVMGVAAVDTPRHADFLAGELTTRTGVGVAHVVNDVVGSWAAATRCRPGMVAISGTGSNVLAVDETGRAFRVGGWDYVLGDEGSAYGVALDALRAVTRAADGRGDATALVAEAAAFFEVEHVVELPDALHKRPVTKSELAAFATRVLATARAGDAVARRVVDDAVGQLFVTTSTALDLALAGGELDASSLRISFVGGMFENDDLVLGPLVKRLEERFVSVPMTPTSIQPLLGPAILALRASAFPHADADIDTLVGRLQAQLDDVKR